MDKLAPLAPEGSGPESSVAAAEFLLEGMSAHKRLSRTEERGFTAQEKPARKAERPSQERAYEEYLERRSRSGGFN
jgi:magnesium chelatase subunit I